MDTTVTIPETFVLGLEHCASLYKLDNHMGSGTLSLFDVIQGETSRMKMLLNNDVTYADRWLAVVHARTHLLDEQFELIAKDDLIQDILDAPHIYMAAVLWMNVKDETLYEVCMQHDEELFKDTEFEIKKDSSVINDKDAEYQNGLLSFQERYFGTKTEEF